MSPGAINEVLSLFAFPGDGYRHGVNPAGGSF
jgi:hypothetical protein